MFVSVAQTVLSNTLASRLSKILPGFDPALITRTGATDIRKLVPKDKLTLVVAAYNTAINNVYYCALAASCLAFAAACFMEWKSVRSKSEASNTSDRQNSSEQKAAIQEQT